jgi:hypothetical protein
MIENCKKYTLHTEIFRLNGYFALIMQSKSKSDLKQRKIKKDSKVIIPGKKHAIFKILFSWFEHESENFFDIFIAI